MKPLVFASLFAFWIPTQASAQTTSELPPSTGITLASIADALNGYVGRYVTCETCAATQACQTFGIDAASLSLSLLNTADQCRGRTLLRPVGQFYRALTGSTP